ncbi:Thymidylate kinase [hydrothermal vent metagenome]|uniref:dTMP kinase n=1 Tax=hydrothermal vent metagenome TaxID=652676 RepID=A0A1W1D6B9_9ZZZZ
MYIAIEGIDTAGKTTQITNLSKQFPNAIITKEPGATSVGKKIREIVLNTEMQSKKGEFLLFLADRAEHIQKVIQPNYKKNMIISDRSAISGIAYALVQGEIETKDLIALNNFATNNIYPQKVFLLYLTEKELKYRLSQKQLDGIELRGISYLLKIQDALIKASKLLNIKLIKIDATQPIQTITQEIVDNISI